MSSLHNTKVFVLQVMSYDIFEIVNNTSKPKYNLC